MRKRWRRLVIRILAAGVCVLALTALLLQTPLVKHFAFKQLQTYLNNKAKINLQVAVADLDFFRGTIHLEKAVVKSTSAPDLPPIFKADRIDARLNLFDAIHKHWTIDRLELGAPQIHYYVGSKGQTNLPASKSSSSSSPDLLILHAAAQNGSFKFEDFRKQVFVQIPQWHLSVKGNRETRSHHFVFGGGQESQLKYLTHTIPINTLDFAGVLQKERLKIESAQIVSAGSKLSIRGSLSKFSNPVLNLQLIPDLDLNNITAIAGLKEKAHGNISGTIRLNGTLNPLQITAQLKASDIRLRDYPQMDFNLNSRTAWFQDSGKLKVQTIELASPEGALSGTAELFTGPALGTNTIDAKIRNLNLFPLWKQLYSPFDLASRSSGTVQLRWKGAFTPSKLIGNAHLKLIATRSAPGFKLLPISGTLSAKMQSNRILADLHSVTVFGTTIGGRFALDSFNKIEGSFSGDAPDIDVPMTQLASFLNKSAKPFIGAKTAGPFHFQAQVGGRLSRPEIVASLDTPQLRIGALKHLNAKTQFTIRDSRISFHNTIALSPDSSFVAQGNLELGGTNPRLDLDAHSAAIPVSAIFTILDRKIPASGNLRTTLHIDGPLDNLAGKASISGDDLSLHQESLGHLDAEFRLSNGEIQSTQLRLLRNPQSPGTNRLDAQISYSLDSQNFRFQAEGKDLTLKQLTLSDGNPFQGTINLLATGTGTIEQPSIDLQLESGNIQAWQRSLGAASVHASLKNEQIALEALFPGLNVSSTIRIENHDPYPFTGELRAKNSDMAALGLKGSQGQPLTGTIEALFRGTGNLEDIAQTRISADIQKLNLQAGKLEAHLQDPIRLQYHRNSIEVLSPATIVSGNSKLEISGTVPVRQSAPEGLLRLKGQLDLAQASGFIPAPNGFAAQGILNLDFVLGGTPQKARSAGTITLDNGTIQIPKISVPLTAVTLRANVQDGALVLEQAEAAWGEGKIALTGELPLGILPENIPFPFLRKAGPVRFDLDLEKLKPEVTGMLPQGTTGLISLHATGQANRADLRALRVQAVFRDLNLTVNNTAFNQKEPSTIFIQDGIVSVSRLSLIGGQANIEIGGSGGLFPGDPLDLRLMGTLDAAFLTAMSQDLKAVGKLQIQITVAGNRNSPVLSGLAAMNDGKLNLRNPRIVADSISMLLNFSPDQITVREFKSTLNGGPMTLAGTVGYRNGSLNDFNLKATLQDFFLNFPNGLKSVSSGNLTVTSSDDSIVIGGNMSVQESSYREPIEVGGQLLSYLKAQQVLKTEQERSSLLSRIRLNVAVRTRTEAPVLVQNNIARLEAGANLRIVGSFYEPSMVGRITLNEGGEIILNQKKYYISRGILTLTNQNYVEPELNIRAQTKVGVYEIALQLTGTPERISTALSSDPPASEADILSLLLTGRVASETQNPGMVRTQALSLLAGEAGEGLTRGAREALHLSTFRVDPNLISSESDPGARLTLGEDITRNLSLAYSMNLVNGGEQIWAVQYNIVRRLMVQATKQQDNKSYRFEFRHDWRFGGPASTRTAKPAPKKLAIGVIQFQGEAPFTHKNLLDKFEIKTGDKYDFPKIQKGLDRLHNFYIGQKRLEADIRLKRETGEKAIDLKLNIASGPTVAFSFDGFSISEEVKNKVEKTWTDSVFESERFENTVKAIRLPLIQEGYLQSEITYSVELEKEQKLVHFQITPGTRYPEVDITFPGASEISAAALKNALDLAGLRLSIHSDPQKAVDYLKRYYRERGYLQAQIDSPQLQLDPVSGKGLVSLPVREGPLFTIGDLRFSGNSVFNYDRLWSVIPTSSGSSYNPNTLRDAVKILENLYRRKGYSDAGITFRVVQDSQTAHAHVTFQIVERKQSIIRDIVIEGNSGTSRNFIQQQLDFQTGNPLDFAKIDESRKRLYATGVYTSVDFQTEDMESPALDSRQKSVRIRVRLRETRPYRLQYGLFYDTERGLGGLLEAQNLNVMGRASNFGLRLRYDTDLKEARIYYNQPFIRNIFPKMDASAFIQQEKRDSFDAKRIGFSLFREVQFPRKFRFDFGYRYDHVRWNGIPPDPQLFQASDPVARVIAMLTRDTRDSILDATRGEFSSHSLEYGPEWLGSETGFARYYGQYFRYVPLDKYFGWPRKDNVGNPVPPRLVYAGALRLGLTSAFNHQSMISPERFFAGGGTTLRGFDQDRLGPLELQPDGKWMPTGGEALFLFNNELRFPIRGIFQGVGFVDIGNVYSRISDFNFSLRKSAGVGLRIKIKYVPLRFDYGYKLDRRPGESAKAFYFSIGQSF